MSGLAEAVDGLLAQLDGRYHSPILAAAIERVRTARRDSAYEVNVMEERRQAALGSLAASAALGHR